MTKTESKATLATAIPGAMQDDLCGAWHRYVDLTAPLRPALHGCCRRLTGNLWDAEDLVQDTLLRGFGLLGHVHHEIQNPRAYLLRTATNLWIDTLRAGAANRGVRRRSMRAVGAALDLRARTRLYRYPTPAPGVKWETP